MALILLVWKWRDKWKELMGSFGALLTRMPASQWLTLCFVAGTVLRVWWRWEYPAPQQSDQATYFTLARNLIAEHQYGFADGGLAYWPPGYPFFLSVWFFIFGFGTWVPLVANLCLFGGTLVVVARLANRIGGERTARLATLLVVPWPTMVMITGFSGKELLVVFLLCAALLMYSSALDAATVPKELLFVVLAGLLLGAMNLTQPSFLLFPLVLIVFDYLHGHEIGRTVVRATLLVSMLFLVILPWTFRNHRALGAWVPISTNGGDVFYRANNPVATGGYTPRGEQNLADLDEVSRGKAGFRLGTEWIRTHPGRFLLLGVRKQILFLGDDAQGAYESLKRGLRIGGLRYAAWKAASNLFWWTIWAALLLVAASHLQRPLSANPLLVALVLSIFYLLAIHSVFESGGKYHVPLLGVLAVVAGQVGSLAATRARPVVKAEKMYRGGNDRTLLGDA
jgi:4-amino-4-deoxy-L-arabinose transferase-like glycosyltransferase